MAKQKLYYIKERHNPQFKKPYYVPKGQLTKKEAEQAENSSYGSNVMLEYKTLDEYNEAILNFRQQGFNIH